MRSMSPMASPIIACRLRSEAIVMEGKASERWRKRKNSRNNIWNKKQQPADRPIWLTCDGIHK